MIVANRTLNAPETYICKLPSEILSREYECQKYIADVDSRMKRFTETEKWRDPWFRKLSAGAKLAFLYIIDNCDNAGVWTADKELADFSIGMEIPWVKVLEAFGERVSVLPSGDWLIVRFVEFQFGKLSKDCKPHLQVMRLIEKHRVSKGYPKGFGTLEDKEEDKEKDKKGDARGKPESRSEVDAYAAEIGMSKADVDSWFDHFEANGWKVGGKAAMKDWQAALRNGQRRAPSFSTTKPKPRASV